MNTYLFSILNPQHRHKVFISYHHANDEYYRSRFEQLFVFAYDIMVSKSVRIGDLGQELKTDTIRQKIRDGYLRDSTVTVVLVGAETWKRKHVDWEIGSSIRDTPYNPRSGLLGVILPTYPRTNQSQYDPYTIPPRLYDNILCGFAALYNWNENGTIVQKWIHEAYARRDKVPPHNSRLSFGNNHTGERWQP